MPILLWASQNATIQTEIEVSSLSYPSIPCESWLQLENLLNWERLYALASPLPGPYPPLRFPHFCGGRGLVHDMWRGSPGYIFRPYSGQRPWNLADGSAPSPPGKTGSAKLEVTQDTVEDLLSTMPCRSFTPPASPCRSSLFWGLWSF